MMVVDYNIIDSIPEDGIHLIDANGNEGILWDEDGHIDWYDWPYLAECQFDELRGESA